MRLLFAILVFSSSLTVLFGQEEMEIKLNNPSFEDIPRHSITPRGWWDCGFPQESPPDVQPSGFKVTKKAQEGNTYLGLVVRDNDTWEAVGQRLSAPMVQGQCYEFSIFMSRSDLYISQSQNTQGEANFTTPAKLRIYGGNSYCDKQYLLAESNLVTSPRWIQYTFKLEPIADYTHIVLEAFYKTPTVFTYNGHILLDNASSLALIPCSEDSPLAKNEAPEIVEEIPDPEIIEDDTPETKSEPVNTPPNNFIDEQQPDIEPKEIKDKPEEPETRLAGYKHEQLNPGQIVRMDNLYFQIDQAQLQESSFPELDTLFRFLVQHPDVTIEIGGHTNGLPTEHWFCDSLSTARAKTVADYLKNKGIDQNRLEYKGYGKRKPLYSDRTEYGRRKNQRVEIKILNINT